MPAPISPICKEANTLLRDALCQLGEGYLAPSTVDDTGMKSTLADVEEKNGHEKVASSIRYRCSRRA